MPPLRAEQAKALVEAHAAYHRTKRQLDDAKERLDQLVARYADRLPEGTWVKAAGHVFRRSRRRTGQRFSLSRFLERHKLTKQMKAFVSEGTEYEHLEVKPRGPASEAP